ncbi:sulfatase [Photobacterium swingsii]|uniref:Sulfatase n=3 Tax=Photobacterium swingsii TaxID=680026 RepID=A0A2T3P9A8_9GAMM|nr:sulfatase-like hydrolase/transferase [Photobacterium swingsii]PSW25455.1 sulfatase [Photobacterium swingsii]
MSITRRRFMKGAAVSGALAATSPVQAFSQSNQPVALNTPTNPKNILIITADQLAKKAVAGYGNTFVKTPAIDSLIRRGHRFEEAYCAFPLCAPSRASFWTGKLPHQTGVYANSSPNIPQSMPTLGQIFTQAGYECVHFGKQHDYGSLDGFKRAQQVEKELASNSAFPVNYDSREDVYCLEESAKYLKQYDGKKPFMMAVEFNNPHNICGWVGAFEGEHGEVEGIGELPPLPDNFDTEADLMTRSKSVQYSCCTHNRTRQSTQWNALNFRQYLKAYYHYTQLADECIEQVLETLRQRGLEDETLVVFFSDHGDSMGAHRLVTKMNWFYQETTNVPLVFSGPGITARQTHNELVSLCDLLPTLCDYVGIAPPAQLYGRSLLPLLRGEKVENWRQEVVSQWHTNREMTIQPGRMMRTERYKYIVYQEDNDEELYDLLTDPGEKKNLSKMSEFYPLLTQMRAQFKSYLAEQVDPFLTQEAVIDQRWRAHPVGYKHHKGDSSIDLYLRNIRPLEKQQDYAAVEKAKREVIAKARASTCKV